jgi:hypothetical protein
MNARARRGRPAGRGAGAAACVRACALSACMRACLHGRVLGEGRVAVRQLQQRDAKGPDVRGAAVPAALHHLHAAGSGHACARVCPVAAGRAADGGRACMLQLRFIISAPPTHPPTSGAIQQGVPTIVMRPLLSPPQAATRSNVVAHPKSPSLTHPAPLTSMLPALTSLHAPRDGARGVGARGSGGTGEWGHGGGRQRQGQIIACHNHLSPTSARPPLTHVHEHPYSPPARSHFSS